MAIKEQTVGFWKGLPIQVKLIIIGGVLVGGYFLYKKLKKSTKANKEEKEFAGELEKLIESGIKPTLSPTETRTITEGLYNSMNNYNYLGGSDTYLPDFKKYFWRIKNKADLFAIMQKWDAKDSSSLRDWIVKEWDSPCEGTSNTGYVTGVLTLGAYTSDKKCSVKEVANDHLKSQGIDYRF